MSEYLLKINDKYPYIPSYAVFCSSLIRRPKISNSLYIVLKEGFPSGASDLYKPTRSRFNSMAICAMPFERAMCPIVSRRKSGSFSSINASTLPITRAFCSKFCLIYTVTLQC